MLNIILIGFFCVAIPLWISVFLNKWLSRKYGCDIMEWHLSPKIQGFDGCSFTGVCPRCNNAVLQDGQGNWF